LPQLPDPNSTLAAEKFSSIETKKTAANATHCPVYSLPHLAVPHGSQQDAFVAPMLLSPAH
jgi:hypothetical protein